MATVVRSESRGLSKPAVYTFLGLASLPRFRGRARDGPRKTYYVEIRLGRLTKNEYPTKNLKSTSRFTSRLPYAGFRVLLAGYHDGFELRRSAHDD